MIEHARHPTLTTIGSGITQIDTMLAGEPEFNAVYLLDGDEPTLVEAGPGADVPVVLEALQLLGIGEHDIAHIVVTHIHIDHAGAVGSLMPRFPGAVVHVHDRGAPHLADPTRLVASTARTYGRERMLSLYGETLPVPSDRIRAVVGGDHISLGDRTLRVLHTPGHASHHVALVDESGGGVFTGEAIGSHLPWADCYRPALPPPEVDVEVALASIELIRAQRPSVLLTSHFGVVRDADEGCDRGADRIRAWSEAVRSELERDPAVDVDAIAETLHRRAAGDYFADAGGPIDLARYNVIGSIEMNAAGLARYWRKRLEADGTPAL
ncbi:MAG: MBL fold metallo-hydrolase [Actinomycetota bacterium]|nr:MBL fold metallo-hydrolase [Actinomycetota bacterium]